MFILNWELALTVCIVLPIFLVTVKRYRTRIHKTFYEIRQKVAMMNANVEENVSGIRVSQSLAVEDRNIKGFNNISQQNFDLRMKSAKLFATMNAVVSINTFIILALMMGYGGYLFIVNAMSIGVLIAFVQYANQFINPVQDLASMSNTFIEMEAAILHIKKGMQIHVEIPDPVNPISLPEPVQGEIRLNDVRFRYTPDVPLFEGLNLTVNAHEKLGIVGETGAGKTTLINLITRIYDVLSGSVEIDGIDIRSLRQKDLRSLIAIVSQNAFLFADSIFNNIRFSRPTATDEEVYEAARMAKLTPLFSYNRKDIKPG